MPCELSDETISEPDHCETGEVDVLQVKSVLQDVTAAEVSVHQSPRLVFTFALNDLIDYSCKLLPVAKDLSVNVLTSAVVLGFFCLRLGCKSEWELEVLSTIVVPVILVLLEQDEVDGLDRCLCVLNPFEDELKRSELWIEQVLHEW